MAGRAVFGLQRDVRPQPRRVSPALAVASVASSVAALLFALPAHAEPCNAPTDCESGFCVDGVCCDSACPGLCEACTAALKGSGEDGTCGQMPAGALCDPAHCDGDAFAFVDDSFCDAAGACIAPAGVDCLKNEPCKFDLCGGKGCEQVTMLDGTECGAGQVCSDGVCGRDMSSSSSGMGSGGDATGGGAAAGGAPGSSSSGAVGGASNPDLYPPREEDEGGCGCRTHAGTRATGAAFALCVLALLAYRRRVQNRKRGGATPKGS